MLGPMKASEHLSSLSDCLTVIVGEVFRESGILRMHICTAKCLVIGIFANGGFDERGAPPRRPSPFFEP